MRRGENQSTWRKTSQSKGELNPHIMSTLGFEPGPYWSETSALTPARTTLLPNMYEYEENQKKKRLLKNLNNNNVHTYV